MFTVKFETTMYNIHCTLSNSHILYALDFVLNENEKKNENYVKVNHRFSIRAADGGDTKR